MDGVPGGFSEIEAAQLTFSDERASPVAVLQLGRRPPSNNEKF